ncbi:dihydrolipoamide acetyltransferase family protein [Streptomyces coeruleoprunus]|uniref:Dihydrolipoamide acetyltransferase component of pyruvate dehydrogenase complex n=1 Tax=Streptomyces coeruleoprunus TaxID=285563 RepID=A0ABV9XEW3_9ACTN
MSPREFRLPDLGEGLVDAEIVRWLVAVGDTVAVDQPVVEVETAKSAVEIPSPHAGIVVALHASEGGTVSVDAPLLTVGDPAGDEPAKGSGNVLVGYGTAPEGDAKGRRRRRRTTAPHGPQPARHDGRPDARRGPRGGTPVRTAARDAVAVRDTAAARDASGVRDSPAAREGAGSAYAPAVLSPVVRRLAAERGLDLRAVDGTGPGGLITRRDVEAAAQSGAAATPEPAASPEPAHTAVTARVPLTGVRRTIAERLTRSAAVPTATVWVDADVTDLVRLRDTLRARSGDAPGLLALLARITAAGLRRFPELNASVEGDEIVRHADVHLGIAVQTPRGLLVPVVRHAGRLTARETHREITRLVGAARAGELPPAELTGSTFTLNNYGGFGVDGSSPLLNPPEAGILGVGRVLDRPWVVDGALTVRKVAQFSLVFDHRVCDGETAGGFLRHVADHAENPALALADL